jgi:molybdopterin molybdotransferase
MTEFLVLKTPDLALSAWLKEIPADRLQEEQIETVRALNRVLSMPVVTSKPVPEFPRSTMDGYAVRAKDTHGASESLPAYFTVIGEVPMGGQADFSIGVGQAALIHTGGMIPAGADAVVMLENVQKTNRGDLEVTRAVAASENMIQIGEDIPAGQTVIDAGTQLQAAEIGGLMSLGQATVKVFRKPVIGILSSGDEVIEPTSEPVPGQVRDINSYSISACIEKWGGEPIRLGIIPDNENQLRESLSQALRQYDAVVISAGSSASVRDHTSQVINELGKPGVIIHGVNIKPGKPTILAVCDGKPIIGLPGNPVSALVITRFFVKPLVEHLAGAQPSSFQPSILAKLTVNLSSQTGREDWWPVRLIQSPEGILAEPVFYKSNLIFTHMAAHGLIKIPADANGIGANTLVEVYNL